MESSGFDIHVPFVEHLGIRQERQAGGRVLLHFAPEEAHLNSWNGVHGGVLMTLLDVAMGSAARSMDHKCNGAMTVEMKVNFIAAATGAVRALGWAQPAGRTLYFTEAELRDAQDRLLAKASGTFKLRYPPAGA